MTGRVDGGSDAALDAAADSLRRLGAEPPRLLLMLGSGLGGVAEALTRAVSVPTGAVPGFPPATVRGHAGRIFLGHLEGLPCILLQGRLHNYEGYGFEQVSFPVRLAHRLGADTMIATNAAGGIAADLKPGSLMLIEDHVSLFPLLSPGKTRIRKGSPYCRKTAALIEAAALRMRIPLRRGTYAFVQGPSYETPAEIRALRQIGADAVGMSTIPEVLQAGSLGMSVAAISSITNRAAGLSRHPLRHEDVLASAATAALSVEALLREYVSAARAIG